MRYGLSATLLATLVIAASCVTAQEPPPSIDFTVNTTADLIDDNAGNGLCHTSANTCSLRAAIMEANHLSVPELIVTIRVPAGTFALTRLPSGENGEDTGDLNLTAPLGAEQRVIIVGIGASRAIIDANHIDRVLRITAGRNATVQRVVIRNGTTSGNPNFAGGGIYNSGSLALTESVVEGNAGNYGGGVLNTSTGTLTVTRTTIRSNLASGIGGGLYLEGPTTIRDSTVHSNTANLSGGGIGVAAQFVNPLSVVNSTISYNVANGNGGGISNQSTTFLYNTSVIGNDADHDQDEKGGSGGGVHNQPASRLVIVNALIADNTLGNVSVYNDCAGVLEAHGWNLFNDTAGCTIPNAAAWGFVEPNTIGTLQDNGGPTWTHALLAGSRAIDTTDNTLGCIDETGAFLLTDQRGASRVIGARCDVGAFEFGAGTLFRNSFE
ncbi:MAG: CSLREA domain-containing protein [Pseudomonadota bacterium]|nr:CSLREA domain-containing protein [Pseudomonadota bacterium]